MTLVNSGCICGICEATGQGVHQTPGTFPRLLQALDLNKLPPLLTEEQLRQRIGLCNRCENKIKLLEEACNIRDNLKKSFISHLKHLTGNSADCITNESINGEPYNYTFQQKNEITPEQHSMKRKISSVHSTIADSTSSARRKQLKTQITHTLPISPASVNDSNNSSDEENIIIGSQLSPVSPNSSYGSYTPTGEITKINSNQQVFADLSSGRNRRKQARPIKASGNVVPAVTTTDMVEQWSARLPTPESSHRDADSPSSINKLPPKSVSPRHREVSPKRSRSSTPSTLASSNNTNSLHQAMAAAAALPFSSSFYQNMFANNLAPVTSATAQANPSAMLLAQSIYNRAAAVAASAGKNHMMANPMMFGNTLTGPASATLNPFIKSMMQPMTSSALLTTPANVLMSGVKREPTNLSASFNSYVNSSSTPSSPASQKPVCSPLSSSATSDTLSKSLSADAHTLIKTDKRRYCKVCASSSRKANNGRPPQSRFLCVLCNMPMCRSCIEEHRYRVMLKEEDPDSKSASARLLQAVKMKDKASNSSPSSKASSSSSSKTSTSATTPPSNSSLIYGSMNPASKPSAESVYAAMLQSPFSLPSLALQGTPKPSADTKASKNFIPIAPAPPKLTDMSSKDHPFNKQSENHKSDEDDDDDDESKLVISEHEEADSNHSSSMLSSTVDHTDQTEITEEIANKTAAMLADNVDESTTEANEMSQGSNAIKSEETTNQDGLPNSLSTNNIDCSSLSSKANNIPLQKCAVTV